MNGKFYVTLLLGLFVANGVVCEEKPSFFQNDFARTPIQKEGESPRKVKEPKKNKETKPDQTFQEEQTVELHTNDSELPSPIQKGPKIESIGMVINATDPKHFEEHLGELLSQIDKHDVDAGVIYQLGDHDDFNAYDQLMPKLIARGALFRLEGSAPRRFTVTKSPSWILQVEEGLIVLEAPENINRYISQTGHFVSPASVK